MTVNRILVQFPFSKWSHPTAVTVKQNKQTKKKQFNVFIWVGDITQRWRNRITLMLAARFLDSTSFPSSILWYKTDRRLESTHFLWPPAPLNLYKFSMSLLHCPQNFQFFRLLYVSVNTNKEKFFVLHFTLLLLTPRLGYKVGIHIIS